jgi:hypothetical protein
LRSLGKQLASSAIFWGADSDDDVNTDGEPEVPSEGSVIRCQQNGASGYQLYFADAVGVVGVGDLVLIVQPKIDMGHLLYLLAASGELPTFDAAAVQIAEGSSLRELMARWYVDHLEKLIERGLRRDYRPEAESLRYIRGRVNPVSTVQALMMGRVEAECEFEEFDEDTPLNRVLLAAADQLIGEGGLGADLQRRAQRLKFRMDGIGPLQSGDISATVDRVTAHYSDAIVLARALLRHHYRSLATGESTLWAFLIRTPRAVERGLVAIMNSLLAPDYKMGPRRHSLGPGVTVNPDIVIDETGAIADVKYKIASVKWRRNDLYQIVAFAEALKADRAAIIDFADVQHRAPALQVGDIATSNLTWQTADISAPDAASRLADDLRNWIVRGSQTPND